jgi:3D (Asp-Asp-Asp) domain-containing protein
MIYRTRRTRTCVQRRSLPRLRYFILLVFLFLTCITCIYQVKIKTSEVLEKENKIDYLEEIKLLEKELECTIQEYVKFREDVGKTMEGIFSDLELGSFRATHYTRECGWPWDDGFTKTMTRARKNWTVAVDPKVVKLGSMLYIVGRGWYRAEDIGGAIKGNRVDIYVGEGNEGRRLAFQLGVDEVKVFYQPASAAKSNFSSANQKLVTLK